MSLRRLTLAACCFTASGLTARIARAGIRVAKPTEAAQWYADSFALETAAAGADAEVRFEQGFALRMLADGESSPNTPDAMSFYGLGLEVQRATLEALCAKAKVESADQKMYASLVPDEEPKKETVISLAQLEDASGYRVFCSAVPTDAVVKPAPKIVLVVSDVEASVKFYTEVLGLRLLRKRALLPHQAAMSAILGYDDDASEDELVARPEGANPSSSPRIELRYLYANDRVDANVGFENVVICSDDVESCALAAPKFGGNVTVLTRKHDNGSNIPNNKEGSPRPKIQGHLSLN